QAELRGAAALAADSDAQDIDILPCSARRGAPDPPDLHQQAREQASQRVAAYKALLAAGLTAPCPDPYQEADRECNRLLAAYRARLAAARAAQQAALAAGQPPPYLDKRGQPLDDLDLQLRVARQSWLANRDPNNCDATRATASRSCENPSCENHSCENPFSHSPPRESLPAS